MAKVHFLAIPDNEFSKILSDPKLEEVSAALDKIHWLHFKNQNFEATGGKIAIFADEFYFITLLLRHHGVNFVSQTITL